jgi:SAM-dependent methyltransferase
MRKTALARGWDAELRRASSKDRSRLAYKLHYGVRHPVRVVPYARRWTRNVALGMRRADHITYYAEIMRANIARGAEVAVGSPDHDSWIQQGVKQFEYMQAHGLRRDMRMLEIGCGNLRAGRLFVDYLAPARYHGVDISSEILLAAAETVADYGLQGKLPQLTLVRDLRLRFFPDDAFDLVHAHSVFSHSPLEVIEECLAAIPRVLAPGGFFDFTYHATDGPEHSVLREDFYYRTGTLVELAARCGLRARPMADWRAGHSQSRLRVTRADS